MQVAAHAPAPTEPVHILGAGLAGLSAAMVLARAGREVHVHELRGESGARFHGDFQGLENWSSPVDFLDQMQDWGFDTAALPTCDLRSIDLALPSGEMATLRSPRVACRLVRRGPMAGTLDQVLKAQALAAGAHLHYRDRFPAERCQLIATGPPAATGVVHGELFATSHPDQVTLQLNDRLAPGAYTYLIVNQGIGLVCTVLLRRQKDPERFLHETLAWYHARYPALDRRPIRRVRGVGAFALSRQYAVGRQLFAGEAGGLQDAFWGFGIRYAITSGVLAARSLLGELDYEREVRRILRPTQMASLANRWLFDRLGPRGLQGLGRVWLRAQEKRGDGLSFLSRLYRPSGLHRLLGRLAQKRLVPVAGAPGRPDIRYLPLAPALPRDHWPLSTAGRRVATRGGSGS